MRTLLVGAAVALMLRSVCSWGEPSVFMLVPRELHPGDIIRVTMDLPPGVRAGSVTIDGRMFQGFLTGGLLNVYFGLDLDTKPGSLDLHYQLGGEKGLRPVTVLARKFGRESLKVASRYTDLDKATLARVQKEHKKLLQIWHTTSPKRLWTGAFVKPADGPAGSPFGLRRFFNGEPRSPHAGLDIKAPAGSGVWASNSGRVVLARELFFTGNTVIIDHGLGLYTIYAHLSRIDVAEGAAVERSERIGLVGATGRVTGPHLHWAVKLGGARVDPAGLPGLLL